MHRLFPDMTVFIHFLVHYIDFDALQFQRVPLFPAFVLNLLIVECISKISDPLCI